MIDNNKRVYKKWMNRRVVVWNIQRFRGLDV